MSIPPDQLGASSQDRHWWIAGEREARGPYHEAYLVSAIRIGVFKPDDLACPVNGSAWKALDEWPAFAPACAAVANPGAPRSPNAAPPIPQRMSGLSSSPALPPSQAGAMQPPAGSEGAAVPTSGEPRVLKLGRAGGLIFGAIVGGTIGWFMGAVIGVPQVGACLTGLVTGALAGAFAAGGSTGPQSPPGGV